jgi:glycosyltransferase involved in cell wall biosynthesis
MRRPAVSIVVPAYNTAPYIAETLSSVLAQTFTDYEIIVINDGSPDTPALESAIHPFRDRIHYIVQDNRGLSGARNTGIAAASGEYIALLDSDDLWEPDYLDRQLEVMRNDPELAVVYPNARRFGDRMRSGRLFMDQFPSSGPVTFESLVQQECNVMVSVLARRDVLIAAGLFDDSLRSSEDFDLWLRLVQGGWRIGYHRHPIVRSRLRPDSLTADSITMCQHIIRVLAKTRREMTLTPRQIEIVEAREAYYGALLRLHEGRKAFFEGDRKRALAALADANVVLRRWKIAAAMLLVRIMPGLLLRAYDMRDRLVFRTSTR